MLRKDKRKISYRIGNVKIRPASLGEEYEIGGWKTTYPWVKMGYEFKNYNPKYFDVAYVMLLKGEIVGYFIAYTEVNLKDNNILPLYRKELILYDFVVDVRAYSKYTKLLINSLIKYAEYNGYFVVSLYKLEEYKLFNNFIKRYYDVKENENKLYFVIKNPRISCCKKHLIGYEKDRISFENLNFLYDLNFNILKTKCTLKLNEFEKIVVDRITGLIKFPSKIKLSKDMVILNTDTRTLIHLIISHYHMNNVDNITIYYDINNPTYFEADVDGLLYVSKDLKDIRDNQEYINSLISRGYDRLVPNYLRYDMNDNSFCESQGIYKLVNKH